ncbi:MAG: S8 family serine peptidase [Bacteroidota bacterium]
MMKNILLISLLFSISCSFNAQQLMLKSGSYDIDRMPAASFEHDNSEVVEGYFFRIVVFNEVPDHREKMQLEKSGVTLLDYLPRNAFIAAIDETVLSIDKKAFNIHKIVDFKPEYKMSEALKLEEYPAHALKGDREIQVVAQYYSSVSAEAVEAVLNKNQIAVADRREASNAVLVQMPIAQLDDFFAMTLFQYFDVPTPPAEPENLPGRTEHRSNVMWKNDASGLRYRADGMKLMMQDDGYIGPHIDYEGRIDQSECNSCSTDPSDDHGDHVAGTIMGAGNLDPTARGMAHGADLLVYNSWNSNYSLVPDLYQNDDVYITSKSYSNGCNAGYTNLTQQLDNQVRLHPSLIHVFSAGNSGNSDCGYGAGSGWGNITGGHKSGKNVMCVGNLSNTGNLRSSSSRGPAEDGRIKPDICGVGTQVYSTISDNSYGNKTGTSMSCPGVAGTLAQLYDAYQDINGGMIPRSGLIKAAVLNSADDLGNPGPDFKHGWGSINARRAFETIEQGNYVLDSIDQGQQNVHTITVPAGTEELRVMVYWTDYEGSTNAATALVNDLNMVVEDPSAVQYQPWVLDPSPNVTALDANAVRGTDSLNNMEQVTIDSPAAGTYTVTIDGYSVPQGLQKYHIVHVTEGDEMEVTYPSGFESLAHSENQLIRWDAPAGTDPFTISFSPDDGNNWSVVGTAQADERNFSWNIPAGTPTGLGRIKVERNGLEALSDTTFTVLGVPQSFGLEWVCPDSMMLSWDPVNGATGYEVSELGNKYMDSIAYVTDTNVVLQYSSNYENWFSVKALGADNAVGRRAVAIQKTQGQFNCTWSAPIAGFEVDCPSAGQEYCFTMSDESLNTNGLTTDITWYFPGGTPSVAAGQAPQVCYSAPGDYDVAMVVETPYGTDSTYETNFINVTPASYLPYVEGFESHTSFFGNPYWSSENISGGNAQFKITSAIALSGSKSAYLANFGQPEGSIDELTSGPIDLSSLDASDDVTLSFRYAYRKRTSDDQEWLRVKISKGCDEPFYTRKAIVGDLLSPEVSSNFWAPESEEDWVTVHITNIFSSYFDENFKFKFEFESDGGNNFYLDDINIYEGEPSDDIVAADNETIGQLDFSIYPNPATQELNLKFSDAEGGPVEIYISNMTGKRVAAHEIQAKPGKNLVVLDTPNIAPGIYLLSLKKDGVVQTKKITFQ